MADAMTRWSPRILSLLRLAAGLVFMEHGTQKLFDFPPSGHGAVALFGLFGLAGVLECFGGALLTLGLFTRPVAFVLSGEMAVAYFLVHFRKSFFPILSGGDQAVLFCFIFFYLVFAGGGVWSLDRILFRR